MEIFLEGDGSYAFDIVGESHYQDALEKITGGKTEDGYEMEVKVLLVHEDGNPYDSKAVSVSIEGDIVGYLDKRIARQFRKRMAESGIPGYPAVCNALIVGGWDRGGNNQGHFGVELDLFSE